MIGDSSPTLALIGLGNPGKKYANTRHNMGFMVIEELAKRWGWTLKEDSRLKVKSARGRHKEREVHLVLPQTYMNQSGWAVRLYTDYYKMTASQLRVICDDISLGFGHMRVRLKGSAGGHNGLKSIIQHLDTQDFVRLKLGIGSQVAGQDLADYVLAGFSAEETRKLGDYVQHAAKAVEMLMEEPLEQVISQINTKLTL